MNIVPINEGNLPLISFRDGDQTLVLTELNKSLRKFHKKFGYEDFAKGLEREIIEVGSEISIFFGTLDDLWSEVYEVIKNDKIKGGYALKLSSKLEIISSPEKLLKNINWFLPKKNQGKLIQFSNYK